MKNVIVLGALLLTVPISAQKINKADAQLPYGILGLDSATFLKQTPSSERLEKDFYSVSESPLVIMAKMSLVSNDNGEKRVTTVLVRTTSRKEEKAILREFPGKFYRDSVQNVMPHPLGFASVNRAYSSHDTNVYLFELVPHKMRLPDYSAFISFLGSDIQSYLSENQMRSQADVESDEPGGLVYIRDTFETGDVVYHFRFPDVDILLIDTDNQGTGGELSYVPRSEFLVPAAREMFKYYFPQFIEGDADYELRLRTEGSGDTARYYLGYQWKSEGLSRIMELNRQQYLDLLEELSEG